MAPVGLGDLRVGYSALPPLQVKCPERRNKTVPLGYSRVSFPFDRPRLWPLSFRQKSRISTNVPLALTSRFYEQPVRRLRRIELDDPLRRILQFADEGSAIR